MKLNWKPFYIHLKSFNNFLKENIPNSDGIVCSNLDFEIIEKNELTTVEYNSIINYYDSLTESSEQQKKQSEETLKNTIKEIKKNIVNKNISELTICEKKILFNIELTSEEIESLS